MWKKRWIYLVIICLSSVKSYSQTDWTEWSEQLGVDESSVDWEELYEELGELAAHPIPINTATKEQLEQLPFLSDALVASILHYVYRYGPLQSVNELSAIEGMNWKIRKLLAHFIVIRPPEPTGWAVTWKSLWKYHQQELITRVNIPFQQKAGYAAYPQEVLDKSPNKQYYGDPYSTNFRYRFQYRPQVFAGITADKDAGEPFFRQYNRKGYDSYTGYVFLRQVGRWEAVAIGHYRARFGYGLVMNSGGFFFNQWVNILSATRAGNGLSKYSSTGESGYLQGIGGTYRLSHRWQLTGFWSLGQQDGNVENGWIRSFKTDGYHRLPSEMEKKHTFSNQLIGSHIAFNGKYVEGGFTAVYNVFNKVLNPVLRPYNVYAPRGKEFWTVGGHYKFFLGRWIWAGEVAVDRQGKIAALNMLTYSPTVNTSFLFMNRYYDKYYQALYALAFSVNSMVQNELGIYLGMESQLFDALSFSCHVDVFHFPYRRFQVDALHTTGLSGGFQTVYSPVRSLSLLIKYNFSNKAKNFTDADRSRQVLPLVRHRVHGQVVYAPNEQLQVKSVCDYVRSGFVPQEKSAGWLAGSTVRWSPARSPLQVAVSGAWFTTDDYDARVYLYEPNVLYAYTLSSYYGRGIRWAVNGKYTWKKRWTLQVKYGHTYYTDRDRIGSGTEEIQGNNKSDLILQWRWKW